MEAFLIGMRFVQYLAVMVLFGSSLFPYYALTNQGSEREYREGVAAFIQRIALYTSIAALLSAVGWLACEAVLMSGDANGYRETDTLMTVLNATEFGRIWRWRLVWLLVLPIYLGWRALGRYRPLVWPILVSGIALLAGLAGVGHGAMGVGFSASIHLTNQAVHLLAAAVWVGGLLSLYFTIRSAQKTGEGLEIQIRALTRFSSVGLAAVLLILATGLLNSWFLVGTVEALLHTTYGQVLLVKVSFFLCMIALALFNRLFLMPRLTQEAQASKSLRLLLRSVGAEQIFAVLVVASVSVLGMLPPAFDMSMPGMAM